MKKILVTGSSGLIGSEVCVFFSSRGYAVHGVDNNQRAVFFGPQGLLKPCRTSPITNAIFAIDRAFRNCS